MHVKAALREVEAGEIPENEGDPRAKHAKRAKDGAEISTISTFSTPPTSKNQDIGKLESLKLIYGDLGQGEADIDVPFTDHEIAEHLINAEVHRDDRPFVRQQLIGAYGSERLTRVDGYLEQFRISTESVDEPHKKSNAGRRRANTWLRQERNRA